MAKETENKEKKFYGLNNDYMFRAVMQIDKEALSHLVATLMGIDTEEVISCDIENPIVLGENIEGKEGILDILLMLNNNRRINIELQMYYDMDWTDRSLFYWSKVFLQLDSGDDYDLLLPTIHIGIMDYTLFPEYPEFYSEYRIMNVKNHHLYTDKFGIMILDLSQIYNAPKDINPELIRWAKIFMAETLDELKELVEGRKELMNMVSTVEKLSEDTNIKWILEAQEDHKRRMNGIKRREEEYRKQKEEFKKSEAEFREHEAEYKKNEAEFQQREIEYKKQIAEQAALIQKLQEERKN